MSDGAQTLLTQSVDDEDAVDLHNYSVELSQSKFVAGNVKITYSLVDEDDDILYKGSGTNDGAFTVKYGKYNGGDGEFSNGYQPVDASEINEPGDYCIYVYGSEDKGYTGYARYAKFSVYAENDLGLADISFADDHGSQYDYTGSAITPKLQVEYDGKTLTEGTDYTVSYQDEHGDEVNPVDEGTYFAVVKAIEGGSYSGSQSVEYSIYNYNDFSHASISETGNYYYAYNNGKAVIPSIEVELYNPESDEDEVVDPSKYTLKYIKYIGYDEVELDGAPVDEGYYEVYAVANAGSGYAGKTDVTSFEIVSAEDAKNLEYATVGTYWYDNRLPSDVPYTGNPVALGLTVTMADGTVAQEGADYAVTYQKGTEATDEDGDTYYEYGDDLPSVPSEAGRYQVTITGKSADCTGTSTHWFNIVTDDEDAVAALIGTLPDADELTLGDADRVATARAAYDVLSDEVKAEYFTDEDADYDYRLAQLKAAEAKIADLQKVDATITASNKSVVFGKTVNLGAKVDSGATLIYNSSNTKVATVTSAGKVKGVKAGKATITIKAAAKGKYRAATKKVTVTVTKAANTVKVKAKTATVKYAKVKKKVQTLKASKVVTVKSAKGTVTYAKAKGNKKITVNKKTGKVTVKKGLKKGTYSVKVKVKAAGNGNYKAKTVTVTFKIKVK